MDSGPKYVFLVVAHVLWVSQFESLFHLGESDIPTALISRWIVCS